MSRKRDVEVYRSAFSNALISAVVSATTLQSLGPIEVGQIAIPLVRALSVTAVIVLGQWRLRSISSPLGLAVLQLASLYNIIFLAALVCIWYKSDPLYLNISAAASVPVLVLVISICHGHLRSDHGKIWRMVVHDRIIVHLRLGFNKTKTGITNLPFIGAISGLLMFFSVYVRDSFEEKRWTFGHLVLVAAMFVEAILFCGTLRNNIQFNLVINSQLGKDLAAILGKAQAAETLDLVSLSLFGVVTFAAALLVRISYLKSLAVLVPLVSIVFLIIRDSVNESVIAWQVYVIAVTAFLLGLVVIRSRRNSPSAHGLAEREVNHR